MRVSLGQLRSLDLPPENNELLSEQRIFRDQVSPTTCSVREGVNDKSVGEWLGILFDELLPKIDGSLDHAVTDSK
jgi:hypothetical protein